MLVAQGQDLYGGALVQGVCVCVCVRARVCVCTYMHLQVQTPSDSSGKMTCQLSSSIQFLSPMI